MTKFMVVLYLFSGRGRSRVKTGERVLTGVTWGEMGKMPKRYTHSADFTKALDLSKMRAEDFLKWTGVHGEVRAMAVPNA